MDIHTTVLFVLRWIHLIAGIVWIGHLYFFNFVNANLAKTYDADTKRKVVPELLPRALFWFRWGAMVTFVVGWLYIIWKLYVASDAGMRGEGGLLTSSWGQWISIGAGLGSVMWFNVWFIIWPNQKKIISAVKAGAPPDAKMVNIATQASKLNTYLSFPMLFCMSAASHLPVINPFIVAGAVVVGFAISWHIYKVAATVKMNW